MEVGAGDVVGAVVGAARVVVGAIVVVGSGGRVVVVEGEGLGGLGGFVVVGAVIPIVVRIVSRSLIMGSTIAALFFIVSDESLALTGELLIGTLSSMNIPKNKLVNKTTTTRLNSASVH